MYGNLKSARLHFQGTTQLQHRLASTFIKSWTGARCFSRFHTCTNLRHLLLSSHLRRPACQPITCHSVARHTQISASAICIHHHHLPNFDWYWALIILRATQQPRPATISPRLLFFFFPPNQTPIAGLSNLSNPPSQASSFPESALCDSSTSFPPPSLGFFFPFLALP